MFSMFNKVTLDPRSGRPIAPVFWQLTTFYTVMSWFLAGIMTVGALLARRDSQFELAMTLLLMAVFLISVVEWRRRQIRRAQAHFREMVRSYEDMLDKSSIG